MRRCSCVIRTGVYNKTREGGCICQGQLEFSKVNERGAFQVVAEQYRGMVFRVPEYHSASRNTILRPGIPFCVPEYHSGLQGDNLKRTHERLSC